MPIFNYTRYARGPQIRYSDVKYGADSYVNYVVSNTRITKPDPQRRRKPKDLFRNGTYLGVTVEKFGIDAPASTTELVTKGVTMTRFWYHLVPVTGSPPSPDTRALKNKLLSQIKSQSVNLPVLVGELGKTTDMFFELCRSVISGVRKLLSIRKEALRALKRWSRAAKRKSYWLRKYRRLTKKISDLWLEYSYGWKPLANDIWELSQALQTPRNEGDRTVTCSIRESKTDFFNGPGVHKTITVKREVEVRAKARFKVMSQVVSRAQQFGLTNPASVAWELTPFSFIIDYVFDVGDFLDNLDALVNVSDAYWYSSSRTFHQCSAASRPEGYMSQTPGFSWWSKEVKQRTNTVPLTWSGVITVDGKVNASRTANITALLRQQMRF